MLQLKATVKGIRTVSRRIENARKKNRRAMESALKRTGFLMKVQMSKDLRKGIAGSTKLKELRIISRLRKRPPLRRFAALTRYRADQRPFRVTVGFLRRGKFSLSEKYQEILKKQFEGFTERVTLETQQIFTHWGMQKSKRSRVRMFYFLKDTTTEFEVPERPFIDLFWRSNRERTKRELTKRYLAKMRGQRI
jgi:hypothetical protein